MSLFKAQVNFINEWVLSIRPFFSINQKSICLIGGGS